MKFYIAGFRYDENDVCYIPIDTTCLTYQEAKEAIVKYIRFNFISIYDKQENREKRLHEYDDDELLILFQDNYEIHTIGTH